MRRAGLLAGLLFAAAGCCSHREPPWVATRLYLGTNLPGGTVPAADLARFLDEIVSPAFPDGFTRYDATGQWRGKAGSEREATVVIEVVHHAGDPLAAKVLEVASAYRATFHQESVLVTDGVLSDVRFLDR